MAKHAPRVSVPIVRKHRCRGKWGDCPNAYQTLVQTGNMTLPAMRCRLTGEHPDDCANNEENER
jgi:hypothetical protein